MSRGFSDFVAAAKLATWMQPFSESFTTPTWQHVLVLIVGAILAPGRRTVAAALRVTGLDQDTHFTNYHRVLNRNRWRSRALARRLLRVSRATSVQLFVANERSSLRQHRQGCSTPQMKLLY